MGDPDEIKNYAKYEKKWDGLINSTLGKLEAIATKLLKEANLLNDALLVKIQGEKMETIHAE